MSGLKGRFGDRVDWITAPENTARWFSRAMWEHFHLPRIARETGSRFYFTPSGIAASSLDIPQVVFCQNPWAMVPAARRKTDALKAWLQRRAYRDTMRRAAVMVFNSHFMQQVYRQNAGFYERKGVVVYQAADDETRRRAEQWRDRPRKPGQILCVSAMAPHKNVEALIGAFAQLVPEASLRLVGSWPDPAYEARIRRLVADRALTERVRFDGFVSREELDRLYAESQVFCLMSRCESFGIPAIEAQLFGTPVVCSTVCAVPEICGDGGLFVDPDGVNGIAAALSRLLTKDAEWRRLSALARSNAARYTWEQCSRPLAEIFERMTENGHE